MATRLYLTNRSSPVAPAIADWQYTAEAVARALTRAKFADDALTQGAQIGPWTAGQTALDRQYIGEPLAAQTISGTASAQLMVREFAGTDNARMRVRLRVISGDGGTVRGTLLALAERGPNVELATSLRNKTLITVGTALASVLRWTGTGSCTRSATATRPGRRPRGRRSTGATARRATCLRTRRRRRTASAGSSCRATSCSGRAAGISGAARRRPPS